MKESNLNEKQKSTKNRGWFAKMQKGVLWVCFLFYWCVVCVCVFFFCVFLRLFCVKKAQKGYFPAILEVFSILLPQKACSEILIFFLFCFLFFVLLLSSLSKFHFSLLFVHQHLFGTHYFCWFRLFFFFLHFPFLMFACFFETDFPSISFWNPNCFHFGSLFFLLFFFCVLMVSVSAFLFLCCLFCFQSMKNKRRFPTILVLLVMSFSYVVCFCFRFSVSCVVCLQSKQ